MFYDQVHRQLKNHIQQARAGARLTPKECDYVMYLLQQEEIPDEPDVSTEEALDYVASHFGHIEQPTARVHV